MGAVQKLATVVIIGLVALATILTVYLADEANRRDSEATEQDRLAIERGTDLYIQYCLQCHGPYGLGARGNEDPARVGATLNQDAVPEPENGWTVDLQSDDPVQQDLAAEYIRFRIVNGVPPGPSPEKIMPAFGAELNEEQINNLVYTVQYVDWDYVYNQAVQTTGETVAEAECIATPDAHEYCGNIEAAPPLYPTAPPEEVAEETGNDDSGPPQAGGTPVAGSQNGGAPVMTLEAQDPADWSQHEITLAPGDTIEVVNVGFSPHDFVVDELGIDQDLPPSGGPVLVTIPADAQPGQYEFYCSVPGHADLGMVGTLTIEG